MNGKRKYERYAIIHARDEKAKIKVIVEGESVHLVDFSLGGLYVLSERRFSQGEKVNLSVDLDKQGKIDLTGIIVRAKPEPDIEKWGIAIDLSQTYNLKPIRKR